jgi:hypothetical protein
MSVIRHETASVSKGMVTVQIECRSPAAARKLFRDYVGSVNAGCSPFATIAGEINDLSDRQISNLLHGRDKDDNGEFTASSMGAAQEAARDAATIATVAMPEVA